MASAADSDSMAEDRLPWLETVDEDYDEGPSVLRVITYVLIGLIVIALLIYGVYWLQNRPAQPTGDGRLIEAPAGPYKVKPETPGGMKVEGEGDTAFATSEGKGQAAAAINLDAVPEAPIAASTPPKPKAPAKPAAASGKIPESKGTLKAPPPMTNPAKPAPASAATPGALVQLGSFPQKAVANAAWTRLSERLAYLAPLAHQVEQAEVNGGTTYRLRVDAGSAAEAARLCAKLKVAGEACFVARN